MSFDKIFDLAAGVYIYFYIIYVIMFTTNGILTPNNISTYKATGEAYLGELFNISQDDTAIDLGNEPSVPFDTKDLDTDWSTNIRLKTSSVTQQCIFSIDDGAGGRLIDVMHVW